MIVFDQASVKRLVSNLERLPRRVGIKHLRIGLNAWGGVVRDIARQNVLKRTRLLDKALIVKVTIPDASRNVAHHGKPARVMVGPGRRFVQARLGGKRLTDRKAVKAVLSGKKVRVQKATRYAHLVEKKTPFIAPAAQAGETRGFQKLAQKIQQGLELEAAALPK